jgi:hypothetical protein
MLEVTRLSSKMRCRMKEKSEAWAEISKVLAEIKALLGKYLNKALGETVTNIYFAEFILDDAAKENLKQSQIADFLSDAYPILEYTNDGVAIDNRKQECIDAVVAFSEKYGNNAADLTPQQRIVCLAIDAFSAINSTINLFQRTTRLFQEQGDPEGLACMENTCWEYLYQASETLSKYKLQNIDELREKLSPYLQANEFVYKQFVAGRVSNFSEKLSKEMLSDFVIGGERLLRTLYTDSVELKQPLCNLYNDLQVHKLRETFQESWLSNSVTNILNFTSLLKAFRRSIHPDIEHSMHRKNYLTAITSIIWALYVKSAGEDEAQKIHSNTFKVIDPDDKLYRFMLGYKDLTGLWNDFTLPLADGFCINFRFTGGDHALPILPNKMSRIVVKQKMVNNISCLIITMSDALALNIADLYETSASFLGLDHIERSISPRLEKSLDVWFDMFCMSLQIEDPEKKPQQFWPIHRMWEIMNVDLNEKYSHINKMDRKIAANNRVRFVELLESYSIKFDNHLSVREYDERIVDLSDYPQLYATFDFGDTHLLDDSDRVEISIAAEPERLSLSIFKAAYHMLVDADPALGLKRATLTAENYGKTNVNQIWLQTFAVDNQKVALFAPAVITANDNLNSILLDDVLLYLRDKLTDNSYANLCRVIIPIGEVTDVLTIRRAHLVALVIDVNKQDGNLSYTARIIDPVGYSVSTRDCEIAQLLIKHFADNCGPLTREYIAHEGFFDTTTCGYFTLKIVSFLIDNPQAKTVVGNIPAPDSWWYGTSHNWLSEDNLKSIYKGAWHNFSKFNHMSLAESAAVKNEAARLVTGFMRTVVIKPKI